MQVRAIVSPTTALPLPTVQDILPLNVGEELLSLRVDRLGREDWPPMPRDLLPESRRVVQRIGGRVLTHLSRARMLACMLACIQSTKTTKQTNEETSIYTNTCGNKNRHPNLPGGRGDKTIWSNNAFMPQNEDPLQLKPLRVLRSRGEGGQKSKSSHSTAKDALRRSPHAAGNLLSVHGVLSPPDALDRMPVPVEVLHHGSLLGEPHNAVTVRTESHCKTIVNKRHRWHRTRREPPHGHRAYIRLADGEHSLTIQQCTTRNLIFKEAQKLDALSTGDIRMGGHNARRNMREPNQSSWGGIRVTLQKLCRSGWGNAKGKQIRRRRRSEFEATWTSQS